MFKIKSLVFLLIFYIHSFNVANSQSVSSIINSEVQTFRNINVTVTIGEQRIKFEPNKKDKTLALKTIDVLHDILENPTKRNLSSLTPYVIHDLGTYNIDLGNIFFAQLTVKNFRIKGLNNITIKELDFQLRDLTSRLTATLEKLIIDADYRMHGQLLLSFPYNPEGHFRIIMHNITITDVQVSLTKQDIRISSLYGNLNIDKVQFRISGLKVGPYKMIQATNIPLGPLLEENKDKIVELATAGIIKFVNERLNHYDMSEKQLVDFIQKQTL